MHKALLLVSAILLVRFYIMIALDAICLVGFWVSVLGKKGISQDCHSVIALAGGVSLASASPPEWQLKYRCLRLGACSGVRLLDVAELQSLVKVLAILPTRSLARTLKSIRWTNWDAILGRRS